MLAQKIILIVLITCLKVCLSQDPEEINSKIPEIKELNDFVKLNKKSEDQSEKRKRFIDIGNGLVLPEPSDLFNHVSTYPENNIDYRRENIDTFVQPFPASVFPVPPDNTIYNHITTFFNYTKSFIALVLDSLGLLPASFSIGLNPDRQFQLILIRKDSLEVQEYYHRLLSILSTDLAEVNNILSYIPGYFILQFLIGIPVTIIQKILRTLSSILRTVGIIY